MSHTTGQASKVMMELAKEWEGRVVDGKFSLRQYLGGSEQGAVFLTQRTGQEPPEAIIKLIPAHRGNEERQLSRWELGAKLSHPNLIRIFQTGRCQLGGLPLLYVVEEFAEEDLSRVLRERSLTPGEAREMLAPLLAALSHIHSRGFVHGHLKPSNILAHGDQIKLSSDGLRLNGEVRTGIDKPSPYDPPEAADGKLSPAGDVWSLGMTLGEALTQRLPMWKSAVSKEPPLPETLPPPFEDLARHCLRGDPQQRWTIAQIQAWLQPAPAAPRPPVSVPRRTPSTQQVLAKLQSIRAYAERFRFPPPYSSRRLRILVPVVLAGLALVVVLAGPRLFQRGPDAQEGRPAANEASEVRQKAEGARVPAASRPEATSTSGIAPGEVFQQVLPDVSQKALDTIRGTVRVHVRVAVDPAGRVAQATFESRGPSAYFANHALQAARRWEFWAPKADGRNVASEWILRFEFTQNGTRVFAQQVAP